MKKHIKTVAVNTAVPYKVLIGEGLLSEAGHLIAGRRSGKLLIVTDDRVGGLYAEKLTKALNNAGFATSVFIFPQGEQSKSLVTTTRLLEFLTEEGITRSDALVALGGGVVGDLTGFVASIYLRGIDFWQIPTTVLAAIDSSVGGKTAVNMPHGKNLVGSFHQPQGVICDPTLFATLDPSVYRDGMAEALKYGIIADSALFSDIIDKKEATLEIINHCVTIKRDIVAEDEFDRGARALLNFGHTAAHSIEKLSDYKISHGEAVALGMRLITAAADALGWSKEPISQTVKAALKALGFDLSIPYSAEELARVAASDKKRSGGEITLIIADKIGEARLLTVELTKLTDIFAAGLRKIAEEEN